jgi:DNA-binding CsgD family transcriptional regulator
MMDSQTMINQRIKRITPRTLEMMDRLIVGQSQRMIGEEMGVSPQRVSQIVNSPLFKLELKRRMIKREQRTLEIHDEVLQAAAVGSKLIREVIEDPKGAYPLGVKLELAKEATKMAVKLTTMIGSPDRNPQGSDAGDGSYEETVQRMTLEKRRVAFTPKEDTSPMRDPGIESLLREDRPQLTGETPGSQIDPQEDEGYN